MPASDTIWFMSTEPQSLFLRLQFQKPQGIEGLERSVIEGSRDRTGMFLLDD